MRVILDKSVLRIAPQDRPAPAPGEALVRVLMAGICNTDIELRKGYMNFTGTPGHEFVGVVEEAAQAPHMVGKRVVADINIGASPGDNRHAEHRKVLGILGKDGAFATWLTVPVHNLIPVPDSLSDEAAVFAEPLAAALEIGQQIHIKASDRLAVLGDGKLGLLIAMGLKTLCPNLVLYGKHPEKLAVAAARGVRTELSRNAEGPCDIVVEATGNVGGLDAAIELVRPEGTIVLKTTTHALAKINLARIVVQEITLVGSRCGDLSLALDHLARGIVDPSGLIQATYPLESFEEAFAEASRQGSLKVLLRVGH